MENQIKIFKKSSKTFFYSSLFFPKSILKDVARLYAFVRVADDFVDSVPSQGTEFESFYQEYLKAFAGARSQNKIIQDFVELEQKYKFEHAWVSGFFEAMRSDLGIVRCQSMDDTVRYMYGSATVVGFMMCRILGIPEVAYPMARKLAEAFQYINFIRDIYEDEKMNRVYLPINHAQKFGFEFFTKDQALANPDLFTKFLQSEIDLFFQMLHAGEGGFKYIKPRYRLPITIASKLYAFTARKIHKDPMIVYTQKVKPGYGRILFTAIKTIIFH